MPGREKLGLFVMTVESVDRRVVRTINNKNSIMMN